MGLAWIGDNELRPTQWSRYCVKVAGHPSVKHPKLNVFAARYALARGYSTSHFEGVSVATAASYSAALHVGLAYTALECLESAIGAGRNVRVINDQLAHALRAAPQARMMEALFVERVTESSVRRHLRSFVSGDEDDLRIIAYAVRNLMFHGALTASALTLDASKSRRALLHTLANTVLNATDMRFTSYVQRMK